MARQRAQRDSVGMNSDIKKLTRSSHDRMVGGVAGGLGEYFGIDPTLVRVGFVVATLLSGVGAVAYLALLVFAKSDDDAPGVPVPA
jgi:phage shock protein C